jgi:hypothetical protein
MMEMIKTEARFIAPPPKIIAARPKAARRVDP